jgi:uncharacterized membrane protein
LPEKKSSRKGTRKLQAISLPLLIALTVEGYFFAQIVREILTVEYDAYKFALAIIVLVAWVATADLIVTFIGRQAAVSKKIEQRLFLCHHDPATTFYFANRQFIICSRCTGFYVGLALSALVLSQHIMTFSIVRHGWMASLALALVLSILTPLQGAYYRAYKVKGHKYERFLVGMASGLSTIFYVATFLALALPNKLAINYQITAQIKQSNEGSVAGGLRPSTQVL